MNHTMTICAKNSDVVDCARYASSFSPRERVDMVAFNVTRTEFSVAPFKIEATHLADRPIFPLGVLYKLCTAGKANDFPESAVTLLVLLCQIACNNALKAQCPEAFA